MLATTWHGLDAMKFQWLWISQNDKWVSTLVICTKESYELCLIMVLSTFICIIKITFLYVFIMTPSDYRQVNKIGGFFHYYLNDNEIFFRFLLGKLDKVNNLVYALFWYSNQKIHFRMNSIILTPKFLFFESFSVMQGNNCNIVLQ